jgi:uncharacterized protein YlxW (UPF0749 family)
MAVVAANDETTRDSHGAMVVHCDEMTEKSWGTLHALYGQALADAHHAWQERSVALSKTVALSRQLSVMQQSAADRAEEAARLRSECSELRKERLTHTAQLEQAKATIADLQVVLTDAFGCLAAGPPPAPDATGASPDHMWRYVTRRLVLVADKIQSAADLVANGTAGDAGWRSDPNDLTDTTPVTLDDVTVRLEHITARLETDVRAAVSVAVSASDNVSTLTAVAEATDRRVLELNRENATLRKTCTTLSAQVAQFEATVAAVQREGQAVRDESSQMLRKIAASLPMALLHRIRDGSPVTRGGAPEVRSWADTLQCVADIGSCCLALEQALLQEKDHSITASAAHREEVAQLKADFARRKPAALRTPSVESVSVQVTPLVAHAAMQADLTSEDLHSAIALAAHRGAVITTLQRDVESLTAALGALESKEGATTRALSDSRRQVAALDGWSHFLLATRGIVHRSPLSRFRAIASVVLLCASGYRRIGRTLQRSASRSRVATLVGQPRARRPFLKFTFAPFPSVANARVSVSPPATRAVSLAHPVPTGSAQYDAPEASGGEWKLLCAGALQSEPYALFPPDKPLVLHTTLAVHHHTPQRRHGGDDDFPVVSPPTARRRSTSGDEVLNRSEGDHWPPTSAIRQSPPNRDASPPLRHATVTGTRAALPKPPLASAAAPRSPSPREDLDMSHEILAVITALDRRVDAALGIPSPQRQG